MFFHVQSPLIMYMIQNHAYSNGVRQCPDKVQILYAACTAVQCKQCGFCGIFYSKQDSEERVLRTQKNNKKNLPKIIQNFLYTTFKNKLTIELSLAPVS